MTLDDSRSTAAAKATLFCPACGHECAVDSDWTAVTDAGDDVRELRCSECDERVDSRPVTGQPEPSTAHTSTAVRPTADD